MKRLKVLTALVAILFLTAANADAGMLTDIAGKVRSFGMKWLSPLITSRLPRSSESQSHVAEGKNALYAHDILSAKSHFQMAAAADPADEEAQLYYGITRVVAVYEDQSLNTSALDSVREILEMSGMNFTVFGIYNTTGSSSNELPTTTPHTSDVLAFLNTKLMPEIDGAIANLSAISSTAFSSTLSPSALGETGNNIAIDYADVMVLRSALYGLKCELELLLAYDFGFSPPQIFNGDMNELIRLRYLFQYNTGFLTIKDASRLTTAKTAIINFIDTFRAAVPLLKARTGQANHLYVLDIPIDTQTNAIVDTRTTDTDKFSDALLEIKNSLAAPVVYSFINAPDAERTFDLSRFFNSANPVNLRSKISDSNGDLYISDLTFGGVVPGGMKGLSDEIPLAPGWNLISFAVIPKDMTIASVLSPISGKYLSVWGWDQLNEWRRYKPNASGNTLTSFEPGKAYWIYVTEWTVLEMNGAHAPRTGALKQGWNLIGYTDFLSYRRNIQTALINTSDVKIVWHWNNFGQNWVPYSPLFTIPNYQTLGAFNSTKGYWVKTGSDTVFAPPPFMPDETGGYEVWAGHYDAMNTDRIIENPAKYGYRKLGSALVSDSDYTAKSFNLNSQYSFFVVKTINPVGTPVKIDTITLNGQCFSSDYNTKYVWHSLVNDDDHYIWRQPGSGPCNDGMYFELEDNGGIWRTATGISQITVYGIR